MNLPKCDRKRPCSRCTQLGIFAQTGLCVYEVDDPSGKPKDEDEKSRLETRIAELGSYVLLHSPARSPASSFKSPWYTDAVLHPSIGDTAWADMLNWESSGSSPSTSSNAHSPISTPSPLLVSGSRLHDSLPRSPWKCTAQGPRNPERCNCLGELVCYTTALELASELQRASTVLSRSLNHCFGAPCALSTKIHELESFIGYAAPSTLSVM
ncbi:hypothetical protein B0H12DRAFT_1119216 [Mycena haematopus]|nr:hypothetical protein B0H12DRAFT_1119216 [Mycena haematopus]